jgi:hypothetical protein
MSSFKNQITNQYQPIPTNTNHQQENMNNQLLDPIQKIVTLHDGVAEYTSDRQLEVLLPQQVAKALNIAEEVSFATSTEIADSYFVSYNSEIFDKLESLLQNDGYVASFAVHYDGYLKTSGFEKLLLSTFTPQNGLIRFLEAKPGLTPYVLFNLAYTAEADEKRLGLVSFWVNGLTGVRGVDVGDALLWSSDRYDLIEIEQLPEIDWRSLSDIAQSASHQYIEQELMLWRKSLNRKLERDQNRIKNYYSDIVQEIKRKITKKHLEDEAKEKELARIAATKVEQKRKLKDLQTRYQLKVKARVHSALVIWLQTIHVDCELVRKKSKRVVTAVWNPYTKILEPLRCEMTQTPVTSFFLSDSDVQILCKHSAVSRQPSA